jgi:hypothetical protein
MKRLDPPRRSRAVSFYLSQGRAGLSVNRVFDAEDRADNLVISSGFPDLVKGMTLVMEKNVAFNPVEVGFLCTVGIMFQAKLFTNLVEEFDAWHDGLLL